MMDLQEARQEGTINEGSILPSIHHWGSTCFEELLPLLFGQCKEGIFNLKVLSPIYERLLLTLHVTSASSEDALAGNIYFSHSTQVEHVMEKLTNVCVA